MVVSRTSLAEFSLSASPPERLILILIRLADMVCGAEMHLGYIQYKAMYSGSVTAV